MIRQERFNFQFIFCCRRTCSLQKKNLHLRTRSTAIHRACAWVKIASFLPPSVPQATLFKHSRHFHAMTAGSMHSVQLKPRRGRKQDDSLPPSVRSLSQLPLPHLPLFSLPLSLTPIAYREYSEQGMSNELSEREEQHISPTWRRETSGSSRRTLNYDDN